MSRSIRGYQYSLVPLLMGLLFFLSSIVTVHAEPTIPKPIAGHLYVQDYEHLLTEQDAQAIEQVGAQLEKATKAQIVVAVVPDLQGYSIDEYATAMVRSWGIGNKKLNNGVLLLIAMKEKKSRIEVGYGLEGALSDHVVGRIQDRYLIPDFQSQEYSKGIRNTYSALVSAVAQEYKVSLKNQNAVSGQSSYELDLSNVPWWVILLAAIGIIGLVTLDILFFGGMITATIIRLLAMRGGGGGNNRYGGGSSGGGGAGRGW